MISRAEILGLMLMAGLLQGCGAGQSTTRPDGAPAPLQLLEQNAPGNGSVAAAEMYQLAPGAARYQVIDESGAIAGAVTQTRSKTDRFNASISNTEDHTSTEFWRINDQGDIVMSAEIEYGDNAITTFDPPLVIAYAKLPAGTERSSQAKMRVVDLKNPAHQKETGTAKRTIKYVGDQRIKTPLGEFVAKRIEVHFTADLKFAHADDKTTYFVVPGKGIVAEQDINQVRILGAFGRTNRRTLLLTENKNP